MKLVLTLLVRDEEDIIRSNIEYHLAVGVDAIVLTDNLSTDGTRDIVMEYSRRGVLHYLFEGDDDYAQGRWVSRMARLAVEEHRADWVIHGDADEFWWPDGGSLKAILERVGPTVIGLNVPRHNFVARPHRDGASFVAAMTHRHVASRSSSGGPLQPKVCHRAVPGVTVAQGNHAIAIRGEAEDLPVSDALCIFHYPLRTPEQFTRKIVQGGAAYTRSRLPREVGITWRTLYDLYQRGELDRYIDATIFDDRRIEEAVSSGDLVEDARLYEFFVERGLPL
jgi:hypothetical protein